MNYPCSLNTFGIPFFLSWGRLVRLARQLDLLGPTVICVQEIQQNAYISLLNRYLPTYPHHAIFPHVYAPKGGLGIFSRVPLIQKRFDPYLDRGLRFFITFADWALFKGVLTAHLQIDGLDVFVLNTHLNTNYIGYWHQKNPLTLVQRRQVQILSGLLREIPVEALAVVCGDLNFPRATFLYKELVTQNGLFDPLRDDPRLTYRPFPLIPSSWKTSLDYILLRIPQDKEFIVRADIQPVEDSSQKSALGRFLTDHCALKLNICWNS
jgi:hypothetical protein